jgi:hypothetical protein
MGFKRIKMDGMWCGIKPMVYKGSYHKNQCSLCKKTLADKEPVTLLVNNYEFFPNCFVHNVCMEKLGGLNQSCINLRKSWAEAQKYKHWFVK